MNVILERRVCENWNVCKSSGALIPQADQKILSFINNATGNKFIVIIDEWDVLIRDAASNKKVQEEYINFLRGLFKGTEPTKYICLAFLTGILPVKREISQSALNNFKLYSMLSAGPLASYIGFTEEEVKLLCEGYKQNFEEVKVKVKPRAFH